MTGIMRAAASGSLTACSLNRFIASSGGGAAAEYSPARPSFGVAARPIAIASVAAGKSATGPGAPIRPASPCAFEYGNPVTCQAGPPFSGIAPPLRRRTVPAPGGILAVLAIGTKLARIGGLRPRRGRRGGREWGRFQPFQPRRFFRLDIVAIGGAIIFGDIGPGRNHAYGRATRDALLRQICGNGSLILGLCHKAPRFA